MVWSFFYFAIYFQLSMWSEYSQLLGLPAFWYFVCAFTFESRLFIFVWRARLDFGQLGNEQFVRRKVSGFYILFYVLSFMTVMNADYFLFSHSGQLIFNSCVWIPQILHTYMSRSRRGPSMKLIFAMQLLQSILPMHYLFWSDNFLDREPNRVLLSLMVFLFVVQVIIMHY